MEYRILGRTGVKVSPLCLGTMNFGPRTSEADAIELIHRTLDAGINFIDTANFYGQPLNEGRGQGTTEKIVGTALQNKRDRVILATKFFAFMDRDDPNARGGSRRHIIQACEASLRRLQTDYIDLYQMHRPDPEVPIDETLRALDDLVRAGKVRYIGTSSFAGWQLMESLWTSDRLRLNRFVSEQPRYSLIDRRIENEVVPVAQKYGIAVLPYSPLGGGVLTGKYRRDTPFPEDSRATDNAWGTWATSFLSDKVYDLVDVILELAGELGCTASQISLAWVMQQPGITSAIIGPRTATHLEDNLGALNVILDDNAVQRLNEASIPGGALYHLNR
jgi:aryl-alcohol dehydrogenase-like predicted oxidoreductase